MPAVLARLSVLAVLPLLAGCFWAGHGPGLSGSDEGSATLEGTATLEAPSSTDAEEAVLAVVPILEVYYAQHGSFAGVRAEVRRGRYGDAFREVSIAVRPDGLGYCVEAPASAPSAHFEGPHGPLASGPCPDATPGR